MWKSNLSLIFCHVALTVVFPNKVFKTRDAFMFLPLPLPDVALPTPTSMPRGHSDEVKYNIIA